MFHCDLSNFIQACSSIEEFGENKILQRVYGEAFSEELLKPAEIKKVIICSGQFYYDILERRNKLEIKVFYLNSRIQLLSE